MPRLAVVFLVALLAAACTARGNSPEERPAISTTQPTMTEKEARAEVERIARATAEAIDPEPELDLYRPSLNTRYCDPGHNGPGDPIYVYRAYYLRGIPKERLTDVAHQIRRFWEGQGYVIETATADGRDLIARSRSTGFRLGLAETGDGVLSIDIGSPCVLPDAGSSPADT